MRLHALFSSSVRFSRALLFVGIILFSCVSVRETAAEIIVKVDSLPPAATDSRSRLVGFGGKISRMAQRLESPVDGTITGVQVFWGSVTGNAPPSQQVAVRISSFDDENGPRPATTLATIDSPVLNDVGLNEFRFLDPGTNLIPLAVPVTVGQKFFIDLEIVPDSTADGPEIPGLMMDTDRIQGYNSALLENGLWFAGFTLSTFHGGDLGLRAIIQPVPEPSTYLLSAIGVVGLLAFKQRMSRV